MKDFSSNPYYKVIDKNTRNVIASGKVINHKVFIHKTILKHPLFSFDNKHFFRSNGGLRYYVEEVDEIENKLDIPKDYNTVPWLSYDETNAHHDIVREYDITELDEPVVKLVTTLNKIKDIETTGSCCGHGKIFLYVDIRFKAIKPMVYIVGYVEKHSDEFTLTTYPNIMNKSKDGVLLRLLTNSIGQKAYKSADKFADYLEQLLLFLNID